MGRRVWLLFLLVVLVSMSATIMRVECLGEEEHSNSFNYSNLGGGVHWEPEESVEEDNNLDGGFSSLESMLQWSIGHSDPVKLKEAAQETEHLATSDLHKRQAELKEIMEHLKTPSDAQLMQIAIADLNNLSLSLEDHHRALQELLFLVEAIDNANDMNKLGGWPVVVRELDNSDQKMRIISAWILGEASQNNPVVQKQILDMGVLIKLMRMVNSSSVEEATKGLYAVSALIRNNVDGQELFYANAGELMLQEMMSHSNVDIKLKKKSASLVADLAICQLENKNKEGPLFLSSPIFLKSVVDLTRSTDIDLQEKALIAIKILLQLKGTEDLDFRNCCGLDEVLESMREQLQHLRTVENQSDFLLDVESLLGDVESIFRKKLEHHSSLDF